MTDENQDQDSHPNENLVVAEPDPDPADEAAGSRPERPQSRGVTRRALLGGTALGAGLLAYTSDYEDGGVTHSIARAATVPDEPLITVGPESDPVGYIFESNGDWVFKHEASGNEFFYNSAQDRWETNQELDVPALVADQRTITDLAGQAGLTTNQTISTGSGTQVNLDQLDHEDSDAVTVDLPNNKLVAQLSGKYLVGGMVTFAGSANWSSGDRILGRIRFAGNIVNSADRAHEGTNDIEALPLPPVIVENAPPSDIIIEVFHDRGGDESVLGDDTKTYLTATHLG